MENKTEVELKDTVTQKLQRVIKDELNFQNHLQTSLKKEEAILEIFQNLLVGILVGEAPVVNAMTKLYQICNEPNYLQKQFGSKLLEWICEENVKFYIISLIEGVYESLLEESMGKIQEVSEESSKQIMDERIDRTSIVKQQVHVIANNPVVPIQISEPSLATYKDIEAEKKEANIFEVINLCEGVNSYESPSPRVNQEVMIYTHQQIIEELKFQLQQTPSKADSQKIQIFEQSSSQNSSEENPSNTECNKSAGASLLESEENRNQIFGFDLIEQSQENKEIGESKCCGHFLHGDKIEEIIDIFFYRGESYLKIKWKKQMGKSQLRDSILESSVLKYHAPQELIAFYQRKLQAL